VTDNSKRRPILAIACLSMVSFGIVLASLGASLPHVISRFGIDKRDAGALLSLLSFSVLAGSLVFGPIVDRRGYKAMLVSSFAAIFIGLETIAFAPSLGWLRAGVMLIGFSGGLVNGAANAVTADVSAEQRGSALTFVGGFFGIGAAGVPFVLATFSGELAYATLLSAVGAFAIVPLAFSAFTNFPPPKHPQGFPVVHVRDLLRDPVILLMGVMLFLQSGMETTVGGWTPTYFAEELSVAAARAPIYLALFWLGLMLTRWTLGALGARLKTTSNVRILLVSIAVALASALVLVSTRSVSAAATAVFVLGCGFAPVFPMIFAFVGDRYAHISGTALSVVMTMALVGGMLMPYAAGVVGAARGLRVAFLLVPIALVILALQLASLSRRIAAAPVAPL
jgi:FHS family glucose/mannose:H+ symporter-like MFS transporter